MCQQHLCTACAVFAQLGLVHLRQAHLPNSGGGLQLMHLAGAHSPAQALHAFGDGATGDHDDLAPPPALAAHQGRQLATPLANSDLVQPTAFVGDQAGPHLDHDAARITQHG